MDPFRNRSIPVEGRQAAAARRPRNPQTDNAPNHGSAAQRSSEAEEYYSSETSSSDGDYSDSCSSSYCSSSSESSENIPEWETHIDNHGELFYVQFSSNLPAAASPEAVKESPSSEERQEMLKKKKKSRLSRLLKRRQGKSNKGNGQQASQTGEPNCESPVYLPTKVHGSPADDWSDWTSFTLELEVHPPLATDDNSSATGRRNKNSNLCEALLGFVPGVTQLVEWHGQVSLRQRVIVDKLVPGGPLHQGYAHVQQGDWLEKLNGQNVTHRDLNDILSAIDSRAIVELNFRRRPASAACSAATDSRQDSSEHETGRTLPHGVLLLSHENVTEASAETADILYRWSRADPSAVDGGTDTRSDPIDPVLKWRGAAVTLAHLMPQLTGSVPSSSTFVIEEEVIHLSYIVEGAALFLVAAPASWCEISELQMIAKQLGRLFRFQHGSIRRALSEQRFADEIKRLFDCLFNALLQRSRKAGKDSCDGSKSWDRLANYFASGGQWLALPSESHLDVTLTLNQMEAIDYEDWDEEAISVQRCATIIGSAVYCLGYLVATTFTAKCLDDVGTFLRWNQVLEMSQRRRLSSLIIWREVYPQDNEDAEHTFILIVGSGHTLIVSLLECNGVNQPWDNYPDTFVIEEVQFFLDELEHLELETTCSQILNGPHNPALVTNLTDNVDTKTSQTLSFSITPGQRPTLINYLFLDFGIGMFMAPTLAGSKFINQFRKIALNIHKLFQQTLRAKVDLQRSDWGGPWSDKSLVALQEVSMLFTNLEAHGSSSGARAISKECGAYWVTGRLFTSPARKELYVCYEDGVAQDILDIAFHLGFAALH